LILNLEEFVEISSKDCLFWVMTQPTLFLVVNQIYETRVGDEFVMLGNDVLVKCLLPSFVADNIQVEGWITSEGIEIAQSLKNIGKSINR
jgi:hypothetical protein